jgi:hypothetical protein
MKSFKQFISEGWSNKYRKNLDPKSKYHDHSQEIGGHEVSVHFMHRKSQDPKVKDHHYEVNYTIGNNYSKDDVKKSGIELSDKNKHEILHHVHKTIDRFIRHRKPKSISMQPNEHGAKAHLYRAFAHRLAKKHNGKVFKYDDPDLPHGYIVSFKKNWRGKWQTK